MASYACPICHYIYDEQAGEPREGYPPGTPWGAIPDDFMCPDCAVRWKEEFVVAEPRE
ncbi:MAG TPA: rubredoxin [Noviherbaspirillum sp.]|nr:rubredoxin [Noviherbaspirillum sp.]